MISNLVCLAVFLLINIQVLMAQSGFEQYYYIQENTAPLMVPIVHIEGKHNWFTKVRYNYEEKNSLGVYVSKSFSRTVDLLEYSIEPLVGGVLGKFNGGSFGLNTALDYRNFFFHTQSQFTFSSQDKSADFFFGWYEFGYSPLPWLSFGCSLQETVYKQSENNRTEPGVMLGFTFGKWSFPMYAFRSLDTSPYLVLGVTHFLKSTRSKG